MPGWDVDFNDGAAGIIAYGFSFTEARSQSVGQYLTDEPGEKVQNFIPFGGTSNFGVRFVDAQFPE